MPTVGIHSEGRTDHLLWRPVTQATRSATRCGRTTVAHRRRQEGVAVRPPPSSPRKSRVPFQSGRGCTPAVCVPKRPQYRRKLLCFQTRSTRPGVHALPRFALVQVFQPEGAQPAALLVPARPVLDVEEEVHPALQQRLELPPRRLADRLHLGAAIADQDRLLGGPADIDGAVDADAAVLALLPVLGLDGRVVRHFLMRLAQDLLAHDLGRPACGWAGRKARPRGTGKGPAGMSAAIFSSSRSSPRRLLGGDHEGLLDRQQAFSSAASGSSRGGSTRSTLFSASQIGWRDLASRSMMARTASVSPARASTISRVRSASCAPPQAAATMARSSRRRGGRCRGYRPG